MNQPQNLLKGYEMTTNVTLKAETFEEMHLNTNLLRGIYGYGFENPSAIQQLGIPQITQKKDLIAQA